LVGVTLGAVAGYYRGMLDNIVMWIMTVVWSIPSIMLVIAISLVLGNRGLWVIFVSIGLTIWVEIARVVRGEVMSIKQKLYIESAKAFGLSNFSIIYRHILPNLFGSIIVILFSNFASAILMEAGLSYLGIGVQIPMPSWGNMLEEGASEANQSFLVTIPSLCIIILVLAFNLIGNGLRDALDPKNMTR
jgi:ABC-type dipeptide/oligopeptide/nickel transport system permease subunit